MLSSTGVRNSSDWCQRRIEMHRAYRITSSLIFAAVAVLHFLRLVGPWSIPRWVSWAGTAIPACLSVWGFRLAMR